jgi:RNA polymerase sigma factor (sigma-70 family)
VTRFSVRGYDQGDVLKVLRGGDAAAAPADAAAPVDRLAGLVREVGRDPAALRTLVAAVMPAILRAVRGVLGVHHLEVEDVAQEAALALVEALPGFRFEATVLHFASRIAVFKALAARRRMRVRGEGRHDAIDDEQPPIADQRSAPDESVAAARRRDILRELCDELPPAQSEALILHVMLGFSVEEVADTTQVPANTVRSRLRLAKQALRKRVEADVLLGEALR